MSISLRLGAAIAIAIPSVTPAQTAPAATVPSEPIPIGRQAMRKYTSLFALDAQGRITEAIAAVNEANRLQSGFIPPRDLFPKLSGDPAFAAFVEKLRAAEPDTPPAATVHRLSDREFIPEGIAYDERTRRWFVSSLRGRLIAIDARGRERTIDADPAAAFLGLAIDRPRQRLCGVQTNGFLDSFKVKPLNRVRCYSLRTGARLADMPFPAAKQLNDLVFTRDGTMYVTDSNDGKVYRRTTAGRIDTIVEGMFSPNGIALDGAGHLYVADGIGVGRYRLRDGQWLANLDNRSGVNVGGIDGLAARGGKLYGLQGFPTIGRMIELSLDGDSIGSVRVLATARQPEMTLPTTMALGPREAFILSSTEVSRFGPSGKISEGPPLKGGKILRVPLPSR